MDLEQRLAKLEQQFFNINKRLLAIEHHIGLSQENEEWYQKQLEAYFKGKHENVLHGITDVSTKNEIIEIKCWKKYKESLGQLLSYNFTEDKRTMIAAFFGKCNYNETKKNKIIHLFTSHGIRVLQLGRDANGMLQVNELGYDENGTLRVNTLSDNVQYFDTTITDFVQKYIVPCEENILTRREVKSFYKQLYHMKLNIDDFEKEIMEKYNIEYKDSRFNGEKYRGWLHFAIDYSI